MISICLYLENLWSPDRPQETAEKIIWTLEFAPPIDVHMPFQFKYGRDVRDILGGRHPARSYFIEVEKLLKTYIANRVMLTMGK